MRCSQTQPVTKLTKAESGDWREAKNEIEQQAEAFSSPDESDAVKQRL